MITNNESLILNGLLYSKEYMSRVIPFLYPEYFTNKGCKELFKVIKDFTFENSVVPTPTAIAIELQKKNISNDSLEEAGKTLGKLANQGRDEVSDTNIDWLIKETESWCKSRAIHIAVMQSFNIISSEDSDVSPNVLPDLLSDALKVSFDTKIGHDYLESAGLRHDFYTLTEEKIPFDIEILNKITKDGLAKKTLTLIVGGTGGGKTLTKCHMAASNLSIGKNVLYISMEMSEERIAERIDANLLNINIGDLENLSKDEFVGRVNKVASKTNGRLIVKEYPTGAAHVGHFRALLNELKLKKDFIPDIIYIDYLNICASARTKGSAADGNLYGVIKSVAEEIRGLAVEYDLPVVTSTQINRSGFQSSDPGLDNMSDSFGIAYTADLALLIMSNEQLDELGQIMFKQLKNRYNDLNYYKRFVTGINRGKMQLYDVEESGQDLIEQAIGLDNKQQDDDVPLFDKSKSGGRLASENKFKGINT